MGAGIVYRKDADGKVRLFWGCETDFGMMDPGQDPRAVPEMTAPLWQVLDLTPAATPTGTRSSATERDASRHAATGSSDKTPAAAMSAWSASLQSPIRSAR